MLVQETAQEAITMINTSESTKTQEQRENIFANLMLKGKLRHAIQFISECKKARISLICEPVLALGPKSLNLTIPDAMELGFGALTV
eukprot:scaffold206763_cov73-Attheya_sp.AAC.1